MNAKKAKACCCQDPAVWRKARGFALEVYRLTSSFPESESYSLTQQIRRAAVSIPANIAKEFIRRGKRDKAHFFNMAEDSVAECRYYLIQAQDLGYCATGSLPC